MTDLVNVNGRITPAAEATLSPLDRGFLYGDSVYETIRTYSGVPFRMAEHLERLRRSAEMLGIAIERTPVDIAREIRETLARAANEESAIRVILSRGVGPIGYDPAAVTAPTCVIHVRPYPEIPREWFRDGVEVAIVPVTRNAATALNPAIKSSNLLNNFLAWSHARQLGAYEPLLLNHEGFLAEGASSNLFAVRGGLLLTPPPEAGILVGITRNAVLALARADGIDAREAPITADELRRAEEVFISSTLKGVLPVGRCDGRPIGKGSPGPVTQRIMRLYDDLTQAETKAGSAPGSNLR